MNMRRISTFTGTLMLGLLLIGLDACQPSRPAGEEPILGLAGPLRLVQGDVHQRAQAVAAFSGDFHCRDCLAHI